MAIVSALLFIGSHLHTASAPLVPVWLYIGPDVFLPLTSALAAILGVLLMAWRQVIGFSGKLWRRLFRRR